METCSWSFHSHRFCPHDIRRHTVRHVRSVCSVPTVIFYAYLKPLLDVFSSQLPEPTSCDDGATPNASPTPANDDTPSPPSTTAPKSASPSKSLSLASLSLSQADASGSRSQSETTKSTPSLSLHTWGDDEDLDEDSDLELVKATDDDIEAVKQTQAVAKQAQTVVSTKSFANAAGARVFFCRFHFDRCIVCGMAVT